MIITVQRIKPTISVYGYQKVLPAGVKPEEEHLVSGITGESLDSILYKVGLHCHRATPGLSTRL